MENKNTVSKILKIIGILEIIAGFVLGLVLGREEIGFSTYYEWSIILTWWTIGFVSGMLFIGFSEVIELLQKISDRLNGTNSTTNEELLKPTKDVNNLRVNVNTTEQKDKNQEKSRFEQLKEVFSDKDDNKK